MAVCASAEVAAKVAVIRNAFSFRKVIICPESRVSHACKGRSKPIARHFQSQLEGADLGWMRARRGTLTEKVAAGSQKRLDTVSISLQLSKYQEARPSAGYAIGGPFCGPGRGTPPGNSPAAALGSSRRIDCGRSSGRTGHSCFDAFAPFGKIEASGAG